MTTDPTPDDATSDLTTAPIADPDWAHTFTPLEAPTEEYVPNYAPSLRRREPWVIAFDHAVTYRFEHGHLDVPADYITPDGFRLGTWLTRQRTNYRDGTLTTTQTQRLRLLGFYFDATPLHRTA